MTTLHAICQLIIGLGILNVWILRFNKKTAYRGGDSSSLKEEFATYGLPNFMVWVVGALKISVALALIAGIFYPKLVQPASIIMAVLMLGALVMHGKVKDPLGKSVPAAIILALSLFLVFT